MVHILNFIFSIYFKMNAFWMCINLVNFKSNINVMCIEKEFTKFEKLPRAFFFIVEWIFHNSIYYISHKTFPVDKKKYALDCCYSR